MNYFVQGFGVFLGVIAGTAVAILVKLYFERHSEKQLTRNLKFELDLDIQKIDNWLEELGRYRNAVNGDSLHIYFGYFDLSRALSVTAFAMLQSGLLYKKLSREQIGQLQTVFSELAYPVEQFMNNQLSQFRLDFERCRSEDGQMENWSKTVKPDAVRFLDFWENKFRDHQRALKQIAENIH